MYHAGVVERQWITRENMENSTFFTRSRHSVATARQPLGIAPMAKPPSSFINCPLSMAIDFSPATGN